MFPVVHVILSVSCTQLSYVFHYKSRSNSSESCSALANFELIRLWLTKFMTNTETQMVKHLEKQRN